MIATIYIKGSMPVLKLLELARALGSEIFSRQGKLVLVTPNKTEIALEVSDE